MNNESNIMIIMNNESKPRSTEFKEDRKDTAHPTM